MLAHRDRRPVPHRRSGNYQFLTRDIFAFKPGPFIPSTWLGTAIVPQHATQSCRCHRYAEARSPLTTAAFGPLTAPQPFRSACGREVLPQCRADRTSECLVTFGPGTITCVREVWLYSLRRHFRLRNTRAVQPMRDVSVSAASTPFGSHPRGEARFVVLR